MVGGRGCGALGGVGVRFVGVGSFVVGKRGDGHPHGKVEASPEHRLRQGGKRVPQHVPGLAKRGVCQVVRPADAMVARMVGLQPGQETDVLAVTNQLSQRPHDGPDRGLEHGRRLRRHLRDHLGSALRVRAGRSRGRVAGTGGLGE